MMRNRASRRFSRQGFTLVELLVVIAVVLVLITFLGATLANSLTLARKRATQATILKIHGLVQQRVEAMNRAVDRLNLQPNIDKLKRDFGVANAANAKVFEILVRKQIYMWRFPQNFYERSLSSATHDPATESAALLYWLLTKSEVFGIPPVDESEFSSSEVRDTDGDGLKEFVDSWGHPLRFYRWPTSLFRPGDGTATAAGFSATGPIVFSAVDRTYAEVLWAGLPQPIPNPITDNFDPSATDPLARDPDDPTGELRRAAITFPNIMRVFQNRFHTPNTYHAFLIMSAGPDNILGIGEPYDYSGDPTNPAPDGFVVGSPIPFASTVPALATLPNQGRLAPVLNFASVESNPINDNLTNRKR